jgi:hypothetical protein
MTDTEQIKQTILSSLGLQGAKEVGCNEHTEYVRKHHPDHPKTYLIWANSNDEAYLFHSVKVLDTTESTPRSEGLTYALGRTRISKWYFDKTYGTIDSKGFEIFKESNCLKETPFFRTRMEQLLQ